MTAIRKVKDTYRHQYMQTSMHTATHVVISEYKQQCVQTGLYLTAAQTAADEQSNSSTRRLMNIQTAAHTDSSTRRLRYTQTAAHTDR